MQSKRDMRSATTDQLARGSLAGIVWLRRLRRDHAAELKPEALRMIDFCITAHLTRADDAGAGDTARRLLHGDVMTLSDRLVWIPPTANRRRRAV